MSAIRGFGEVVEGYKVKVVNEREARAAAGILFVLAFTAFLYAVTFEDMRFTKIFITLFMTDFIIRVLVNPKFSPSLILGRLCVSSLTPEYSGAPQKHFAWSLGLLISLLMFYLIWFRTDIHLPKLYVCIVCLTLLFFEAAFGICIGCKLYQYLSRKKSAYCPGGSCDLKRAKEPIQETSYPQLFIVITTISLVSFFVHRAITAL